MIMKIKSLVKEFIPPFILKSITGLFYGWSGHYPSWDLAKKKCTGYDSEIIFNKVKNALLKVKNGEAVYERDSIIFNEIHYSFPLLSALAIAALTNKNKLNVLDFGGSLGSSYYQNRNFFSGIEHFNWCVVEQPHFVKEGQKTFADEHLHFYYDIQTCLNENKIDILLLSSVLQYIEEPFTFMEELFTKNFEYIVIDRMPLLLQGDDRITIQKVPKKIYEARYPCWLLNEKKLLDSILKYYDLLFAGKTEETINIENAAFKTFFFKRKKK